MYKRQTEDKVIDYIALEHIGVINSQTHFSIPDDVETSMQIPDAMALLEMCIRDRL